MSKHKFSIFEFTIPKYSNILSNLYVDRYVLLWRLKLTARPKIIYKFASKAKLKSSHPNLGKFTFSVSSSGVWIITEKKDEKVKSHKSLLLCQGTYFDTIIEFFFGGKINFAFFCVTSGYADASATRGWIIFVMQRSWHEHVQSCNATIATFSILWSSNEIFPFNFCHITFQYSIFSNINDSSLCISN